MNILLVSSYLPYPLYNGGNIRLFNLIKRLSKKYYITLVCETRPYQTRNDVAELNKYCKKVITIPREKQWSINNIIRSGFSKNCFLVTGHTSDKFKKIINELLKEKFDIIHAETFYIMQNIPPTSIPIVLVEHNIEYLVYKRFADSSNIILKPFLYADIFKMKKNESNSWNRASRLVSVSDEEGKVMNRKGVVVVPNGVDLESFTMKKPEIKEYISVARHLRLPEKEILFIGDFKWLQNVDSVKWILNDIWPYLLRAVENDVKINLRIVGRSIPDEIKSLNIYDSVNFDENTTLRTSDIFKRADILLAPIRVGGGTSFKILETMASGTPVVTTSLGIKGLNTIPDKHVLVGDDTQSIVEKTTSLLRDKELYSTVANNARELIQEQYNWDMISKKLDKIYQSLKK